MSKKQDDITERLTDCLNLMLFDNIIDLDELTQMQRKLGVLLDLPDMLTYSDLREIALKALAQTEEEPPPPKKTLNFKRLTLSMTPANGAHDVKGVNPGHETGSLHSTGLPEEDSG